MTDKTSKPNRSADGTFKKGTSGNPGGRPRATRRIPHPEEFRDRVYAIAQHTTPVKLEGKTIQLTLHERNLLTLALAGANGDARAAMKFVDFVQSSSSEEQRIGEMLLQRLKGFTPAYLLETDPEERARKKKDFDHYMNLTEGRRENRVRPLRQRRARR